MHALIALFAAAAVQSAPADVNKTEKVTCRWEAAQSNGIPVKVCMTAHQRKMRTSYTQQQIRESQQRSYTSNN
jgi:murein endopeptidase